MSYYIAWAMGAGMNIDLHMLCELIAPAVNFD